MIEEALLQLLLLSIYSNIALTIISLLLIVIILFNTYKEKHISANQ